MAPSTRNPLPAGKLVLALVVLALLLRIPNLNQSVWFDEACMSHQRVGTFEQLIATLFVDIHPPLFLSFMHFWGRLFGDGEVVMRLPALAAGLGSIPLIFAIGRRLLSERIGLLAALLASLSTVHIWYSIEARLYAPILFLALLSVWLFHRRLDGAPKREWLAFFFTLVAMVGVHYYLATFLVVFTLLGLLASKLGASRRTGVGITLTSSAVLLAILGFVAIKLSLAEFETSQGYMAGFTPAEAYRLLFQWGWTGNASAGGLAPGGGSSVAPWSLGWLLWVTLQILGVGLFLLGLRRVAREARVRPQAWCLLAYLFCLPLFLQVLAWIGLEGTYIPRSAIPFLPFFLLVLAAGLDSIGKPKIRSATLALVLGLQVVNLAVFYARGDAWTVYKPHQDWRSAAAYFAGEIEAGGLGSAIFTTMPNQRSLSYYDARIQTHSNLMPTANKVAAAQDSFDRKLGTWLGAKLGSAAIHVAERVEATKAALLEDAKLQLYPLGNGTLKGLDPELLRANPVFYVLDNHWHPPGVPKVMPVLQNDSVTLVDRREFQGLTVYKLRVQP
jgi:4-amino-4-deoxy-L-arabinose transferase-like glycosyltransferase